MQPIHVWDFPDRSKLWPLDRPRWRRQLLEQTRDKIIVCAQRWYGIFHIAEFALLVGVKLKDVPPSIGPLQEGLSQYGLTVEGSSLYWNFRSEESGYVDNAIGWNVGIAAYPSTPAPPSYIIAIWSLAEARP
jgi:hypothetical protein